MLEYEKLKFGKPRTYDSALNTQDPIVSLRVLTISQGRAYLSFWTNLGKPVVAHYFNDTSYWASGPYRCLGDGCPACSAGIAKHRYSLVPALDRLTSETVLLRIPTQRGPGRLATELDKVLYHPNKQHLIARITRNDRRQFEVNVLNASRSDRSLLFAAKQFKWQMDNQELDLTASIANISAVEMASHPCIASALEMEAMPLEAENALANHADVKGGDQPSNH